MLGVLAGASLSPTVARTRDYASPADVLNTIDRLSADVEAALSAIATRVPSTQSFAASVRADHARERADRQAIRARLRLTPAPLTAPVARPPTSLEALRAMQQDLVHAHAEGLPTLDDAAAVQVIARHLVEASRRLTVIDLWLELEEQRGG